MKELPQHITLTPPTKTLPEGLRCGRCHTTMYLYPGARRMRGRFLKTHTECTPVVPIKTDPYSFITDLWSKKWTPT